MPRAASSKGSTTGARHPGPPGSGKTYTGARMVVRLVASGKKIGISANSHRVIGNFLRHIGTPRPRPVSRSEPFRRSRRTSRQSTTKGHDHEGQRADARRHCERRVRRGCGHGGLWSPSKSDGLLDVLFVDEAGLSLANMLAMSGAARRRPARRPAAARPAAAGLAPAGADRRRCAPARRARRDARRPRPLPRAHVAGSTPTSPSFTSTAFYEASSSRARTSAASSCTAPPLVGAGVRLLSVEHVGNESECSRRRGRSRPSFAPRPERSRWTDKHGEEHPLRYKDVLVVAPYNAQVGAIQRELPEGWVGTVDKSRAAGAGQHLFDDLELTGRRPARHGFLYSRNRLNVATRVLDASPSWWRPPHCCACARGRPSRCAWPMPCASSRRWRPRTRSGGRRRGLERLES